MARCLTMFLCLAVICGNLPAQETKRDPEDFLFLGDTKENFEKQIKPLTDAIRKTKKLVIYEGLPHQRWEKGLLDRELKERKSVKLHAYPFYESRIDPKDEDFKKLTTLYAKKETFNRYKGSRACGGFPSRLVRGGGGARLPSREECAGSVLPPRSVACWRPEGDRGDGAQNRGARVPHAEIRPGVRAPKPGDLRASLSATAAEIVGEEGGQPGLQAGARNNDAVIALPK